MEDPFYKLVHGDCLEVLPTLEAKSVDLIIADPPYNIGKVEWDNIPNYVKWCLKWLKECRRVLKDNGSLYLFHNDILQMSELITTINHQTDYIFKCLITWEKYQTNKQYYGRDVLQSVNNSDLRCYYPMSEYIAFYTLQDDMWLAKNMEACIISVRDYVRSEIIRAKGRLVLDDINQALGTATTGGGVASACFSLDKACPNMITEENYKKLRQWLNESGNEDYLPKDYVSLKTEYDSLREKLESKRYVFVNGEKDVTRTWLFKPATKLYHETPKPVSLIKRILRYSSKKGSVVLDPFAGSGSTIKACKDLQRSCIAIEKSTKYYGRMKKQIINQLNLTHFSDQIFVNNPQTVFSVNINRKEELPRQ